MKEYRKRIIKRPIPKFDPDPSGKFADKVLTNVNAKGVLIGRLAVWAWIPDPAEHAFTKDVDIAVSTADLKRICSWLEKNGIKCRELEIGGINVCLPEGVNVDFITRHCEEGNLSPLFEDAVRASSETVQIGGREFQLAPIEHLTAMKIATGETGDLEDAERLLETGADIEKLRKLVTIYSGPAGRIALENTLRKIGHSGARKRNKYKVS